MTFDEITRSLSAEDQKIIADMMILFQDIDRQTLRFARQSGLRCKTGCGACCENPEVETTVAEVLPLAVHIWSSGLAGKVGIDTAFCNQKAASVPAKGICVFYRPASPAASRLKTRAGDPAGCGRGRCSIYAHRPGLCRLFGFATRKDKYGQLDLVTCKVIKEAQAKGYQRAQEELQKGVWRAPLLTAHALRVSDIDPVNGLKLLPINQAIRSGLEKVGHRIQKFKQLVPTLPE